MIGQDDDLRKAVEKEYESFAGDLYKEKDIRIRIEKAYKLTDKSASSGSILQGGISVEGSGSLPKDDTDFTDTGRGKALARSLGQEWIKIKDAKK